MITSSSNSKIKLIRSLQSRSRNRQSEQAFVAEGVRLVEDALDVGWPIRFILFDSSLSERGFPLIKTLEQDQIIEISEITPELMSSISDTESPQGIIAVLEKHILSLPILPTFLVIADQIRDPGNLGTLIRTAEAAGADAVLTTPGTVDAFSPKVIRAGMGAHFHLPIKDCAWEEIKSIVSEFPVFLAEAAGGVSLWEANMSQPCALLIGGEAFGASTQGEAIATHRVTIPMQGRAESLNAAIAGGILIAEVLRQRFKPQKE